MSQSLIDLVKAYGDIRALQARGGTDASHALAAVQERIEAIRNAIDPSGLDNDLSLLDGDE